MKVPMICQLVAFYLYVVTDIKGSQMTNNCDFHALFVNLLKYKIYNRIWLKAY